MKRYLQKFESPVLINSINGIKESTLKGEIIYQIHDDATEKRKIVIERCVLILNSVSIGEFETGTISVIGKKGVTSTTFENETFSSEIILESDLHFPLLDIDKKITGCYYMPKMIEYRVHISSSFPKKLNKTIKNSTKISLICEADKGELFKEATFTIDSPIVDISINTNNTHNCHPDLVVNKRKLKIQPVGFKTSSTDINPSGSSSSAQLTVAQTIWNKCCIEFDINPIHYVTNSSLKTSSNIANISNSYTHPDVDTIEIFFVDNLLTAVGGGTAQAIGVASQKLVIAEPNSGNPVLVAHELGHALGLLHPNSSDPGSVMQPTGSASNPGTELVSHFMCQNISQPALETLTTTCCLSHDIGDHFIKDFPEDIGIEPSTPLPAGRTRYSMSNVWNRNSNAPGSFGFDGPEHEEPYRFQNDGVTPFTNFLFAQVEQRGIMQVRDAKVRFYVKHPGSGGGSSNITFLGETNVPNSLPANVSIPWTLPSGTPSHSCVFSVVTSPSEPHYEPTTLTWQQLELKARDDNDWAQRNLNIVNVSPFNSGNIWLRPITILIPTEVKLPVKVVLKLEFDKKKIENIQFLSNKEIAKKKGRNKLEFKTNDKSITLVPQVQTNSRKASNNFLFINVLLEEIELIGYSYQLKQGNHRDFLDRSVDLLYSTLSDLLKFNDNSMAENMFEKFRSTVHMNTVSTERLYQFYKTESKSLQKIISDIKYKNTDFESKLSINLIEDEEIKHDIKKKSRKEMNLYIEKINLVLDLIHLTSKRTKAKLVL